MIQKNIIWLKIESAGSLFQIDRKILIAAGDRLKK